MKFALNERKFHINIGVFKDITRQKIVVLKASLLGLVGIKHVDLPLLVLQD